ncbi:arginine--tRNA ligase, partial [Candidatus Kaiserbacteria bacterium]|nr:arginine--tRNA ligase [Candidatus Kaiserbacteria bacterium]
NQGHYATNIALRLAKQEGKTPMALAEELKKKLEKAAPKYFFEKIEVAAPGFINFWISSEALRKAFGAIRDDIEDYGRSDIGKKKIVIVEYSQPNIAKKKHVGHMRTTINGVALANIFEFLGYDVIRWNYLGDWGTQFGKLIAAYKLWGDKKKVEQNPIDELQKLYVTFHDEMKTSPDRQAELEERGREEFKKLEEGDEENAALWHWFKQESLKEFEKMYAALGVKFDSWIGESFYEKDLKPLVERLLEQGVAETSEGSVIVALDKRGINLPPALIRKSDGASLYLTRDIANLEYRLSRYKPEKILYVVGNEQALHFEQLFAVAKVLGLDSAVLTHVKYGLVLGEGSKKLATREGRAILLEDVLEKVIRLAREIVEEKSRRRDEVADRDSGPREIGASEKQHTSNEEKEKIAEVVGIGALKYNDLKENRTSDIVFDWEKMLDLTGDSAPYLQYTYARLRSILRKADQASSIKHQASRLTGEIELRIIRKLLEFPDEVKRSGEHLSTSNMANFLYKLAVLANQLYETTPVLKEENEERKNALLALIDAASSVLKTGLGLLGIGVLEQI